MSGIRSRLVLRKFLEMAFDGGYDGATRHQRREASFAADDDFSRNVRQE
jgi:hypothetical protein